jgi:hypothetical protein
LAAQVRNDFEARVAGSFIKKLSKDLDLTVDQEFRFNENTSQFSKSYSTISLGYELEKWLEFGINYRFILKRKDNTDLFRQMHRVMGDVVLKTNYRRFQFSNRMRVQSEIKTVNYKKELGFSPATSFSDKIKIQYRITRVYSPHLSFDFRFLLDDPGAPDERGFNRHQIKGGVDITLSRIHSLDIYIMTSREHNLSKPKQLFVTGVNYSFNSR